MRWNSKLIYWSLLISLFLTMIPMKSTFAYIGEINGKVIYGEDNRRDLYDVTNPMHADLAWSTVGVFSSADVKENPSTGLATLTSEQFGSSFNLCKTERFFEQPSAAFCSGSLVGPDIIITAGHCVRTEQACANTKFVFGFNIKDKNGKAPETVPLDDVVQCKSIIAREETGDGADFAVIRINRKVTKYKPLQIHRNQNVTKGMKLVMIGHPSGLPTKVDDGGSVRDPSPNGFFVATTDSYGGNSGSAVLNLETGEVEGILVRGEQDFVYKNGCVVSNVCTSEGCSGEDVTKISALEKYIP